MANPNKPDKDHPHGAPPGQSKPKPGDPDYVKPGGGEEEAPVDPSTGQPYPDHTLPGDLPEPNQDLPGDQPYVDPRKR